MTNRADAVAYDSDGNLALVVEVRNKLGTNSEWAARMRQNILIHNTLPSVRFFLLALPDRFYLWKDKPLPTIEPPTYEIDPAPFLQPYFDQAGIQPEDLSSGGFELLMIAWLNELIQSSELPETIDQRDKWLIESGLLDAIKGGHIASEAVL